VGRKKISSSQFSCSNPNWSSPSIKGMWRNPTRNPEKLQLSHHLFLSNFASEELLQQQILLQQQLCRFFYIEVRVGCLFVSFAAFKV
jgi:hypothetical protein